MKKYIYLILITLIISGSIIMSGYIINGQIVQTDVLVLKEQDIDNTITASGKLQYRSGQAIKSSDTAIMESVSVKNGSEVKKGDLLYTCYIIDDAYTAMLSEYSDLIRSGSVSALLKDYGGSEGLMEELKKNCKKESIYAKSSGKVTGIKYSENDLIEKDSVILRISDKAVLEIPVNINENYINQIQKGQKADVVFNAEPEKHFLASVTNIAGEASMTSGLTGKETTVEVTLTLDEAGEELRAGYSAVCCITTSTDRKVIAVPYEAVYSEDGDDFVLVACHNKAEKISVKTGKEYKEGIEILEGLKEGDQLIVNTEKVKEGQRISIRERTVQTNG